MMLKAFIFICFLGSLSASAAHAASYVGTRFNADAAQFRIDQVSGDDSILTANIARKLFDSNAQLPQIPSTFSAANQMREPGTWIMMIVGFATIGCALRRNPASGAI